MRVVRGMLIAIVLGPVMLAGGAVAGVALVQMFISGWNPFEWAMEPGSGGTWLDWAFGGGGGSAARYIVFMAGAMTAAFSYVAIQWGFTGRSPLD